MDDSPLSYTANITGILTFVTAIIAFVYVRYNMLKNGYEELETIRRSAVTTVEDLEALANIIDRERNRPEVGRMRDHLMQLSRLETSIFEKCNHAKSATLWEAPNPQHSQGPGPRLGPRLSSSAGDPEQDPNGSQVHRGRRDQFRTLLTALGTYLDIFRGVFVIAPIDLLLTLSVVGVRFVLRAGVTPALFRWFKVRDEVMAKVQQRNELLSRIQHQQVTLLYL